MRKRNEMQSDEMKGKQIMSDGELEVDRDGGGHEERNSPFG
jgi:hypothetical protein